MARRLLKSLGAVFAGGLLFLLLLEAMLRLLPVDSGLRMQPANKDRPFMLAVSWQHYTYSYGWSLANVHQGQINNIGIANSRDWIPGQPAVLVVGDSYIESLMNDYADTLQGKLESFLYPIPVFAMSHSGANAADYLRMMEFARSQIPLRALIFRIDGNDFWESLPAEKEGDPGHNWFEISDGNVFIRYRAYFPSALKELVRNSALARYMQRNLKFRPAHGISGELKASGKDMAEGKGHAESEVALVKIKPVMDYFLSQLPSRSGVALANTVFVIDCDRKAIYENLLVKGKVSQEGDAALEYFIVRAKTGGATVVKMCPHMEAYVSRSRQRLDFSPSDYHWNPAGHALVANATIPELQRILRK